MRELIYSTTNISKANYLKGVNEKLNIDIQRLSEATIEITLPSLIPKRKKRTTDFITDPLYEILSRFVMQDGFVPFDKCVICFSYIYDKKLPTRRICDYDNIELKKILNVINAFLLTDDSGIYCDTFHSSKLGISDMTKILIMEKDLFSQWVLDHKTDGSYFQKFHKKNATI